MKKERRGFRGLVMRVFRGVVASFSSFSIAAHAHVVLVVHTLRLWSSAESRHMMPWSSLACVDVPAGGLTGEGAQEALDWTVACIHTAPRAAQPPPPRALGFRRGLCGRATRVSQSDCSCAGCRACTLLLVLVRIVWCVVLLVMT